MNDLTWSVLGLFAAIGLYVRTTKLLRTIRIKRKDK